MNKEAMMVAMRRKKDQIKQFQTDDNTPGGHGQAGADDELAPTRASKEDALLGGTPDSSEPPSLSGTDNKNQTALGESQGFSKVDKSSAPQNSKPLFVDPKKDLHDPVDLNRHRNIAGDGSNPKYDNIGVDESVPLQQQASKLTADNASRTAALKDSSRKHVKSSMNIMDNKPTMGEDVPDAAKDMRQQKGFPAPFSKVNRSGDKSLVWDQDKDGVAGTPDGLYEPTGEEVGDDDDLAENKSKMRGLKGARSRLDGFLSKNKY